MTTSSHQTIPALVVVGMHRSGTSFVASVLQRAGCRMGPELLPADPHNRPGYFEDVDFLDLNRRMLAATVTADHLGHLDWGWTEDMDGCGIEAGRLQTFETEADALVARRRTVEAGAAPGEAVPRAWGWKDPRTSVLVDFWSERVPDAKYVLVYREPWDVADSIQRLGADVFLRHPEFAYRIWHHYNQCLLTFARRHRDRVLVVHAGAVMRAPATLLDLVRSRLAVDLDPVDCADVARPELFASAGSDRRLPVFAGAVHADCLQLLGQLHTLADLSSPSAPPAPLVAPPPGDDAEVAIVIPCFDHGEFLIEAIASVEDTVRVPYELVIVNDGSRQRHTLHVLACLRRAGYHVIDQSNRGLAAARNRGILECGRPFFLPLDADNRLRPHFVERAIAVLRHESSIMAVYGDRVEFGLRSGRVQVGVPDLNRLLCGNYIDACAVVRTEAWRMCGGYDSDMPVQGSEDWDLWLSMIERDFVLHRLDANTFDYRVRPGSMLSRASDPEQQTSIERYVLAKHAPLYLRHLRRQVDLIDAISAAQKAAESPHTT